ncbi:MAG: NAD/NADP octopine/nopaline dehydrogenase family protein [Peptostreptococcaceae bacterium]
MKVNKVAILGAGNGGITAAADLSERGFEVSLYEMPKFTSNLEIIKGKGSILLQEANNERKCKVHLVTSDINKAIENAQIVMLTIPGFAVEAFAEILAPIIDENQVILLNGAASMGCVRFINKAKEMKINKNFKICETNSLTYGTRAFANEARVELSLRVKKIFLAAYPKTNNKEILDVCNQIYDCFVEAKDIWHVILENGNPEVHPGPALLNAGRIDYSEGEFWLYKEGITKHTVNILKAIEKERMEIGKALGFELENAIQSRARRGYFSTEEGELQDLFNNSDVFTCIKGPVSMESRYFTEDISTGLVLWSSMGKALGVSTPNIDAVITLGGSLLQTNFYESGLTLEKLGFGGMNREELIKNV